MNGTPPLRSPLSLVTGRSVVTLDHLHELTSLSCSITYSSLRMYFEDLIEYISEFYPDI